MFNALAILIVLAGRVPAPAPEVCELVNAMPGRTPSSSCMGCHDGTIGPVANVIFPSTLEGFVNTPHDPGSSSHPVDLDYDASAQRQPGSLTPSGALPSEVVLQEGKLTCVTCHHPDSTQPFRTSLSMDASALCIACHRY